MKTAKKFILYGCWIFATLLFAVPVKAQAPIYHPGDVIKISITFTGKDAGRFDGGAASIKTSETHADQPNFNGNFGSQDSHLTASNTIEMSIRIPANATSGVYTLVYIEGHVKDLGINMTYNSPADFKALTYTIENPNRFEKPTIKDVH